MIAEKEEATRKTVQVFRYLQAVDQRKNPVIKDVDDQLWIKWLDVLPEHDCIEIAELTDDATIDMEDDASAGKEERFILRVKRPANLPIPLPPDEITPWLRDGWKDCRQEVTLNKITVKDENEGEIVVSLDDDQARLNMFKKWIIVRTEWAQEQKLILAVQAIFETIYSLYSRIERESEQVELMLGDGNLKWNRSDMVVNHPLILQRVDLAFSPSVPEFVFRESDKGAELYSALLRSIPDIEPAIISSSINAFDSQGVHPLGGAVTTGYLIDLAHKISPHGIFADDDVQEIENNVPCISRARALFLRKRTLGFSSAIESILNDLSVTECRNNFIARTVGVNIEGIKRDVEEDMAVYDPNGEDTEVLFTKEANGEQLQIVKYLNKNGTVLVQGPPGTGKTHTIANLIGHFLSRGKNILVTSHSSKALRVLRGHVVAPLQPLCVSVLTDDSRKELERSINDISERLSYSNADILDAESMTLQKQRIAILTNLNRLRNDLKTARLSESTPIVLAGKEYGPIEAAKWVAATREKHDWIPGPVIKNEPCPLSDQECNELYKTNIYLKKEEEDHLSSVLPSMDNFMEPEKFLALVQSKQKLEMTDLSYGKEFWSENSADVNQLQVSYKAVIKAVEQIEAKPRWLKTIAAEATDEQLKVPWLNLIELVTDVNSMLLKHKETLLQYDPKLPQEMPPDEVQRILDEICQDMSDSGYLAKIQLLLKPRWRHLLAQSYVNGHKAVTKKHIEGLKVAADMQLARKQMLDRWQRQVVSIDGPAIDSAHDNPEYICMQYSNQIASSLRWNEDLMVPAIGGIVSCGLNWQGIMDETDIVDNVIDRHLRATMELLPAIIEAQSNRIYYQSYMNQLEEMKGLFEGLHEVKQISSAFVTSVVKLDTEAYSKNFHYLRGLHDKLMVYQLRRELLEKIEKVAPAWSEAVRNRSGIHAQHMPPGSGKEAWKWRQFNDEMDRRAELSIEEIQSQIQTATIDLRVISADLVEKRAWAAQARRVGDEQRLALQGWKMTMKKIGKGTGKLVPMLKAEARKLMPKCQTAVPVWIMPLSRVVETFDPGKNRFDVVIIDEASQADLMAHIALYMGSQIMIVGDDEQVSPVGVGQRQDEMQGLIASLLQGIPNRHLYDSTFSIYDLAMTVVQPICLREHFRCAPEIINFSNRLSYDWKIRPLRDTSTLVTKPHTVYYRVDEAMTDGKVNKKEALAVTALIIACSQQPEYKESTFGVISLLGEEQALHIEALLNQYLGPVECEKRNILCGNSAHFQGDERDIMFLTLVDTCNLDTPLPLKREGAYNMYKKRFNVAASRARNQMWVVGSLNSIPNTDLKEGDYRLRLIQHAINPNAYEAELEQVLIRSESDFEKQVAQRLIQAGYQVVQQWKVGSYRIDIVVEGNDRRLAVECDGDRYHTVDNLQEDMNRQAILERLGWKFVRIRGSQFYRTPDQAMDQIFNKLNKMGILPQDSIGNSSAENTEYELLDRIKHLAAELIREWDSVETSQNSVAQESADEELAKRPTVMAQNLMGRTKIKEVATSEEQTKYPNSEPNPKGFQLTQEKQPSAHVNRPSVDKHFTANENNIAKILTTKGIKYVDKRNVGGALWVQGNREVDSIIRELKQSGYDFIFTSKGGRQTQNKPGWYIK